MQIAYDILLTSQAKNIANIIKIIFPNICYSQIDTGYLKMHT